MKGCFNDEQDQRMVNAPTMWNVFLKRLIECHYKEEMHISYVFTNRQCDDSIFPQNIFTEVLTQNILQINYTSSKNYICKTGVLH